MAAATVASLPVMLVFLIFQKQFIQGVAMTGLKG
jgi:ABC-type glycerol-3-phosphate transport system permease component